MASNSFIKKCENVHFQFIITCSSFIRTVPDTEVDYRIGNDTAIDVKAARTVHDKHLKGLRALKEEKIFLQSMNRESMDGIRCLHWAKFLNLLRQKAIIKRGHPEYGMAP